MTVPRKNPIEEANRYLLNAKSILSEKAGLDNGFYTDPKYVKMAGHTAWCGVLVALNSLYPLGKKERATFEHFQDLIARDNKKLLNKYLATYETLHKAVGYDGNPDARIAKAGLSNAKDIIDWVASRIAK